MKHLIINLVSIILFSISIYGQNNIDSIITEVEKNNTTLSALNKSAESDKIENKTGIQLQNPEIGLNYLWGSPSENGTRTDISISQTFDFPTSYRYKKQISKIRNEQINVEYQNHIINFVILY